MLPVSARLFSELYGFALLNPAGLDTVHGGSARGRNLLQEYSTSSLGDLVCAEGYAVLVHGLEADYYNVIVRHADQPSPASAIARQESTGWVLHVTDDEVVVCGLGYLADWEPTNPRVVHVPVPNGWYEVDAIGAILPAAADGEPNRVIDFVLRPSSNRPEFRADLSREMTVF